MESLLHGAVFRESLLHGIVCIESRMYTQSTSWYRMYRKSFLYILYQCIPLHITLASLMHSDARYHMDGKSYV